MSEDNTDKATILIVDDMPTNIQILAAVLKKEYKIKVATSGQQCLDIATGNNDIDLILLDIEMPDMDGYETCDRLKKNSKTADISVVFVTAKDGVSDEKEGFQIGAVDYITKPVNPIIVSARVKTQITIKRQRDQLTRMATHDQLTNLYNRHYLLDVAYQKIARATRHKDGLSLLMIDIDHFKKINDTKGHDVGDLVIKTIAKLLNESCRGEDIAVRFGGEEFIVLLEHCDLINAEQKAQIIREKIETLKPSDIPVTVSIGVSDISSANESFTTLLKQADDALYKAKDSGRNCVKVHC